MLHTLLISPSLIFSFSPYFVMSWNAEAKIRPGEDPQVAEARRDDGNDAGHQPAGAPRDPGELVPGADDRLPQGTGPVGNGVNRGVGKQGSEIGKGLTLEVDPMGYLGLASKPAL